MAKTSVSYTGGVSAYSLARPTVMDLALSRYANRYPQQHYVFGHLSVLRHWTVILLHVLIYPIFKRPAIPLIPFITHPELPLTDNYRLYIIMPPVIFISL